MKIYICKQSEEGSLTFKQIKANEVIYKWNGGREVRLIVVKHETRTVVLSLYKNKLQPASEI